MTLSKSRLSRRALLALLPDEVTPGSTIHVEPGVQPPAPLSDDVAEAVSGSPTGAVVVTTPGQAIVVAPPFAIERTEHIPRVNTAHLRDVLNRERTVAVLLLRLGGFTIGVFHGEALLDSKTDRRFVKNRHRKGGQSSRRFERIREKQVHELFGKACEEARLKLSPYEREIEHVLFGGDRRTVHAFRKECDYFERFGGRLMPRFLPVPGDPNRDMLESMPREIWSSDVWTEDWSTE